MPFTYDSRALLDDIKEGTYYIKFKIKDPRGLEFKIGDAIPWKNASGKNQQGLAKQIQSNIKFDMIDPTAIDVVQISVKKGEWMDEISDFSKQLDNFKFCK